MKKTIMIILFLIFTLVSCSPATKGPCGLPLADYFEKEFNSKITNMYKDAGTYENEASFHIEDYEMNPSSEENLEVISFTYNQSFENIGYVYQNEIVVLYTMYSIPTSTFLSAEQQNPAMVNSMYYTLLFPAAVFREGCDTFASIEELCAKIMTYENMEVAEASDGRTVTYTFIQNGIEYKISVVMMDSTGTTTLISCIRHIDQCSAIGFALSSSSSNAQGNDSEYSSNPDFSNGASSSNNTTSNSNHTTSSSSSTTPSNSSAGTTIPSDSPSSTGPSSVIKPPEQEEDPLIGHWKDSWSNTATMIITYDSATNEYLVDINWPISTTEIMKWQLVGEPENHNGIYVTERMKYLQTTFSNGTVELELLDNGGGGYLWLTDKTIQWSDYDSDWVGGERPDTDNFVFKK